MVLSGLIFESDWSVYAQTCSASLTPPVGGSASTTALVSLRFIPTPLFRHIWAARNPAGFFIAPPKRHKQPERYTKRPNKFIKYAASMRRE
jgi:hypothetical protein